MFMGYMFPYLEQLEDYKKWFEQLQQMNYFMNINITKDLCETLSNRERPRRNTIYLLVYSGNASNTQVWARLKTGARNSIWVSIGWQQSSS